VKQKLGIFATDQVDLHGTCIAASELMAAEERARHASEDSLSKISATSWILTLYRTTLVLSQPCRSSAAQLCWVVRRQFGCWRAANGAPPRRSSSRKAAGLSENSLSHA